MDKDLAAQKNSVRNEKYHMSVKIQSMMEKQIIKQQRELDEVEAIMSERFDKLQALYRDKANKKRSNRDKITELKQDIIKLKMNKELAWDKITDTYQNTNKNVLEDRVRGLE